MPRSKFLCQILLFNRVSSQFGAFHFGARQFDACQFGAFHFDAVPVRRVSLWRAMSVWRVSLACSTRSIYICGHVSFLRRSVLYARISFLRIIPLCVVHHLFINLVNVSSRLHHSGLVY